MSGDEAVTHATAATGIPSNYEEGDEMIFLIWLR